MRLATAAIVAAITVFSSGACLAAGPLDLKALVAEAEDNNPDLSALKYKYQAARERVPQAGALPDPMLGLGLLNVPVDYPSFDREPMTSKMLEVSQMFPFFGKRELKRKAAAAEAEALEAEYSERALMVRAEVKKAYYGLYGIRKKLEVIARGEELLTVLRKAAEARYASGTGMFKDITKAQLEESMLVEKRLELAREERTMRAYLGSLIGRDAPVSGETADISATEVKLDRDALVARALTNRPGMKAASARVDASDARVESARKEYFPDFTVTAQYMQRDELKGGMSQSDMASLMLSVNLPVWRGEKLDPMTREARLEKYMAERERDSVSKEIYYKVDSLLGEVEEGDRTLKLYKEVVIPKADEDVGTGLANYQAGKGGFLDVIDSWRMLFDYESGYYSALAAREGAVAELEAATGGEQ